jgi:hypothetical protein
MKLLLLPEPSIKVRDLARVWGVTSCWLRKLIGRGELEAVRLGRDWVVPLASANRFFEARRVNR